MADGEEGEILVRGENMMEGLLKQERSRTFDADGWYHTGDRGFFRDGFLFFTGRATEMIKTGGANVAPREVELAVESLPGVQAAFVVGIPDAARGELVACLVCPEDGHEIEADALRTALADVLSSFKIPRRVLVLPYADVPWLGTGKIDKPRIIEMFADARRLTRAMELALTQDTRRPVATAELAAAARAAGFSALGMVSGRCAPEDRTVLADAGLRCHELLGLQVRADAAATIASRGTARARRRGDRRALGAHDVRDAARGIRARDRCPLRVDLRRGRRRAGDRVQPARTGARHRRRRPRRRVGGRRAGGDRRRRAGGDRHRRLELLLRAEHLDRSRAGATRAGRVRAVRGRARRRSAR